MRRNKAAKMLVTRDNVIRVPSYAYTNDRENIVSRMAFDAVQEVKTMIDDRYAAARDTTEAVAAKMDKWDRQYNGEWQDGTDADDERIYLPKTREQVQVVRAYIMMLVSQLNPIVTMQPMVSSIWASTEEYKRAKVAEALLQFHFNDLWRIRDDVFPRWLNAFLKHTMAVWKVSYLEDAARPDLKIDVVDRALLYIDPFARELKDAGWIIEKCYLPRSEVVQRVKDGHWYCDSDDLYYLEAGYHEMPENIRRRYYGADDTQRRFSLEEDDRIEVWEYWQAPIQGRSDVYAVILGGENGKLVRYGRNPFPYKGIPYRSKSYDPHEFRPDGMGIVGHYTPFQELVNNFLNMRIMDVRKNIIQPVAATGRFVDAQTQDDFKNGQKIVRLSDEVLEASNDPAFDLRKHFVPLPFTTSTGELLVQDLPFILGQGKETGHVSDVFKGQAPPHQATLGQIQEQLSRNQGVFRPIYMQVMRGFEELAEICMAYFKSEEYFPEERIIRVIGENKYAKEIEGWHNPGGDTFVRSVSPDEMDIDVTIDAVHAADALASRTFLITSLEQIFQSIGQIPDLFQELKKELDFVKIAELMINSTGQDIEGLRLSPEARKEKEAREEQSKQEALELQKLTAQLEAQSVGMQEQAKQQARAQGQIAIDQNKEQISHQAETARIDQETRNAIQQMIATVGEEMRAEIVKMREEARLERANANLSVGHGNNVNE